MAEYVVPFHEGISDTLKQSLDDGVMGDDENRRPYLIPKAHVATFDGFKVEIFSNEHPPPHFRVKYQGMTANFRISDCLAINGDKKLLRYRKNVEVWWNDNKKLLIMFWNNKRPTDCPVGEYKE